MTRHPHVKSLRRPSEYEMQARRDARNAKLAGAAFALLLAGCGLWILFGILNGGQG